MFEDGIDFIQQKSVTVYCNGSSQGGKPLQLASHWGIDDFLNAASQRLGLVPSARRIFHADGSELDDVMMVEDGEVVFVSSDEDFIHPNDAEDASQTHHITSSYGSGTMLQASPPSPQSPLHQSASDMMPKSVAGFQVGRFLGRGGFGEVRVGVHHMSGEEAALKFLDKAAFSTMDAAERMTTEIECLTALRHPNIIRLLQQLEAPHHVVLVFELMRGGDLYHHLCGLPNQCLSEDAARSVFHQVISAVAYAHNHHICHRDLKLDNILLSEGGIRQVKIADFGLSDFYRPGEVMRSDCGSLSYLAPEVFRGTSNAGPPLDVWSLGVILFALLYGRLPFEGSDLCGSNRPREAIIRNRICKCQYKMDESMSADAKDLVRRLLKLDPAERASVPEIFNHCWLRQRNSTTSSTLSASSGPPISLSGTSPSRRNTPSPSELSRDSSHSHHPGPESLSSRRLSHGKLEVHTGPLREDSSVHRAPVPLSAGTARSPGAAALLSPIRDGEQRRRPSGLGILLDEAQRTPRARARSSHAQPELDWDAAQEKVSGPHQGGFSSAKDQETVQLESSSQRSSRSRSDGPIQLGPQNSDLMTGNDHQRGGRSLSEDASVERARVVVPDAAGSLGDPKALRSPSYLKERAERDRDRSSSSPHEIASSPGSSRPGARRFTSIDRSLDITSIAKGVNGCRISSPLRSTSSPERSHFFRLDEVAQDKNDPDAGHLGSSSYLSRSPQFGSSIPKLFSPSSPLRHEFK